MQPRALCPEKFLTGPTHPAGTGVDIGLFRHDRSNEGTNYNSSNYDRATTQRFVNLLEANPNVVSYYFNDPDVIGTKKKKADGHDDHIHVNFKPCSP